MPSKQNYTLSNNKVAGQWNNNQKIFSPEPSKLHHLTLSPIVAGVAKAGVNLLLTAISMETRCALTGVVLELHQLADAIVLAGLAEADVALLRHFWVRIS